MPRETHDICEFFFKGKIRESAALQTKLIKLVDALFMETNPIPVKTAQNILGTDVGHLGFLLQICRPKIFKNSKQFYVVMDSDKSIRKFKYEKNTYHRMHVVSWAKPYGTA